MLTRDLARLAPRMDLWRLLHFYHSGLGYFVTARMLMLGIYCQVRCKPYCMEHSVPAACHPVIEKSLFPVLVYSDSHVPRVVLPYLL